MYSQRFKVASTYKNEGQVRDLAFIFYAQHSRVIAAQIWIMLAVTSDQANDPLQNHSTDDGRDQ